MKVLVFPRDSNPYQELLYAELKKKRVVIDYLNPSLNSKVGTIFYSLRLMAAMAYKRSRNFRILHVHWFYSFRLPSKLPFSKSIAHINIILFVYSARLLGYRIVWTVHNVVPHEPQTNHDLKLMQRFSRLANAKIVHSAHTIKEMSKMKFDISNTSIIPHGSYVDVYPSEITPKEARHKLHLTGDEFVILFFGQIRAYKGIDDLIGAFKEIDAPKARLVIAGSCIDAELRDEILKSQSNLNINFHDNYIPDEDVAIYFKASDVVCLPFKSITTSGSTLLALSFGKPVVAPRSGALLDLPAGIGYLYDPAEPKALCKSLQLAFTNRNKLRKMNNSARAYVETLSWKNISEKTYEVYQEALSETTNDKS